MPEHYKFYHNSKCEYFPCHKGKDSAVFNCLFCFCPLYLLGKDCGGNYKILPGGIKSCEDCLLPHGEKGYEYVMETLRDRVFRIERHQEDDNGKI